MAQRSLNADNQICFSALCGIEEQRVGAATARQRGILALAIAALRNSSARKGFCIDCPYRGGCEDARDSDLIDARPVETHVPIRWPNGNSPDTGSP